MSEVKKHSFANDKLRVSFDGSLCAHAGYCFQQLHDVFDGDRDPPIAIDAAPVEEIIRVVEGCPSLALSYERLDGGQAEQAAECATAAIAPNGPIALRGDLQLGDQQATRLTLCRCGMSQNKPYCDGSHHQHKWDDGGLVDSETLEATAPGPLKLTPFPNGPVGFDGELTVTTWVEGEISEVCRRQKGTLCRCGVSKNKPFCDGSHRDAGFSSE